MPLASLQWDMADLFLNCWINMSKHPPSLCCFQFDRRTFWMKAMKPWKVQPVVYIWKCTGRWLRRRWPIACASCLPTEEAKILEMLMGLLRKNETKVSRTYAKSNTSLCTTSARAPYGLPGLLSERKRITYLVWTSSPRAVWFLVTLLLVVVGPIS